MSEKTLSIIVPSYNMEKYLPKCLGSLVVAPELMDRLEVLVVNDGSKDRTSEIAHEFASKWPGTFKVIDKENGHYGSCINAGLKVATGEFVKILDADDSFDSPGFALLIKTLQAIDAEVDLVLTDYDVVDEDGRVTESRKMCTCGTSPTAFDELKIDEGFYLAMHAVTYRRLILEGYRQTEGVAYTDNEWVFEPMAHVRKSQYVPCVVYKYLVGRSGQSVDPALQLEKRRPRITVVVESMIERYGRLSALVHETGVLRYLDCMLFKVVADYYAKVIIQLHKPTWDSELRRLDKKLLKTAPILYKQLATNLKTIRFNFHYVANWRKHRTSSTVLLWLYRQVLTVKSLG